MENVIKGLNAVRVKIGQSIISESPKDLNLNKYQFQKSVIDPDKLKLALIKSVDEKYLKPVLKAHGLTSGRKQLELLNNNLALNVPGDTRNTKDSRRRSISTARPSNYDVRATNSSSKLPAKNKFDDGSDGEVKILDEPMRRPTELAVDSSSNSRGRHSRSSQSKDRDSDNI